jgi:Domain of unknown function (DUF4249)
MVLQILKMNMIRLTLISIGISALFIQCETEAEVDLPTVERQLTLTCFISDDLEKIEANLSWSIPVFGENSMPLPPPTNLIVTITNGTALDTLQYNVSTMQYELSTQDFPLFAGNSYTLSAHDNAGHFIEATTHIPLELPSVASNNLTVSTSTTGAFNDTIYTFTFKTLLNDVSSNFDYYRLAYYNLYTGGGQPEEYLIGNRFISDNALENGQVYIEKEIQASSYDNVSVDPKVVYIVHASEDYFKFHKTFNRQDNGNPFAEPTLVFSNVSGGLGIFAGYRQIRLEY